RAKRRSCFPSTIFRLSRLSVLASAGLMESRFWRLSSATVCHVHRVIRAEKSEGLNIMGRFLFLFILVPLLELYLLIKIGGYLGAFQTVALVILTALLGLVLARFEGLRTLQQIKQSLAQGIVPAEEMVDGVLIFAGGILFIIPGVLTDLF